jgi:ssDNA-binding Zn-finger/Zn-ribbon topoisomerase 1
MNYYLYFAVLKCPKCGSDMVLRQKKNIDEYYIGCLSYPTCKNAVWLPSIVKTLNVLPESCSTVSLSINFKYLHKNIKSKITYCGWPWAQYQAEN